MFKISIKALLSILFSHNEQFFIQKSDKWADKTVLRFLSSDDKLTYDSHVYVAINQEDYSISEDDKKMTKGNRVLLHYDLGSGAILSCCNTWFNLIKDAKRHAKQKALEVEETCPI